MLIRRDSNIATADDVCQLTNQWCMVHYKKYLHTQYSSDSRFQNFCKNSKSTDHPKLPNRSFDNGNYKHSLICSKNHQDKCAIMTKVITVPVIIVTIIKITITIAIIKSGCSKGHTRPHCPLSLEKIKAPI